MAKEFITILVRNRKYFLQKKDLFKVIGRKINKMPPVPAYDQ
jgi:hypothetical protein